MYFMSYRLFFFSYLKCGPLLGQILIVLFSFFVALFLAWHTLSWVQFFYPLIYDALDLNMHIQQYAPLNVYKSGFEQTLREQHIRLFGEVVLAINQDGLGLEQMVYYDQSGQVMDSFLRKPEVIHLQDVANLLNGLTRVAYGAMVLLVCMVFWFKITQQSFVHIRQTLAWVLGGVLLLSGAVVLFDAQAIFYYLHTQVFPEEHQWFFYYQESLMTTLMKAPDIFAVIAVLLVLTAVLYCTAILGWINWFLKCNSNSQICDREYQGKDERTDR